MTTAMNNQQRQSRKRGNDNPLSPSAMQCDKQFSELVVKFSNQVEEIIAWLFCKEEQLQNRPNEQLLQEAPFNQLLDEYSRHEKFMTEICEYCHTIMKCKEEGQELGDGDNNLTEEDRDEVGIQMDAMLVLYDKLKILTTDRLHHLQRIIEERQKSKIERLERWLSSMESKLASSDNIGPDYEAIQRQLVDVEEIRRELEQKQEFLNLVSRVIVFDDVDLESSQMRSRSCESLDKKLDGMNHRWTKICQFVNERYERLKKADSIWKLLHLEGPQLSSWLRKVQSVLNELTDATRNITDSQIDKTFIAKLLTRSEKIDVEIKSKQSFYSSLENRVRLEIDKFDDPCSMLVIELEKKLEDMQDSWNSITRQKRMIDFSLQALSSPDAISNNSSRPIIPIPEPITNLSPSNLPFRTSGEPVFKSNDRTNITGDPCSDPLTNSSSIGNDEDDSSPRLNGSLSDARAFDNSTSSQDTRSLTYGNNHIHHYHDRDQHTSLNDNDSHDELSSATNLTSPRAGHLYSADATENDTNYSSSFLRTTVLPFDDTGIEEELIGKFSELDHHSHNDHHHHDGTHNCRVEEWKHSLESFSNWLRQVELSLGMHSSSESIKIDPIEARNVWSKLDLQGQLTLIKDIENRIANTCQDEFDCLILQGQQIIEDLMPEIGENEYEANLKVILADIEIKYHAIKRYLLERKRELGDKEKWRQLLRDLQQTSDYLIGQLGELIPENEIGVDLITLAQQQDQLMHSKSELENNSMISECIQEAKQFLKLCDTLQQQYGHSQHLSSNNGHLTSQAPQAKQSALEIWLSFKEFRDEIEHHLDRLTLHYSELSQSIDDRLARLDEVHKEMHALQHSIQELATELQVAEILKSKWVPLDGLSIEQLSEQLEDLKLYRERLCEVEATHKSMNSIVDWMEDSGAPLSQSNLGRIDELNSIWELIQDSVEDRQKKIEHAFDEQSGSEQKFLAATVSDLPKWERRVATSKVPYFIDHESDKTLWDHPKFTQILSSMEECKSYVFSVYRTAMKLRIVQKRLGIDKLMLEQLKELLVIIDLITPPRQSDTNDNLDTQSVQTNTITNNDSPIGIEQIIMLLKAIYEKIQSVEPEPIDVPVAIDLTLNWILNLYDSTRTGHVSALSLKVGLALICCATREEKYIYMFDLVSSKTSGTVDAKKLGTLFEICMRIPTYLGESESFGGSDLIESSIRNCFAMSKFNPHHPNCIDMNDYLNWLKTEPQFIVWLTMLHRLLISENTVHPIKCKLCNANPIIGLRYRCLRCFKYNICQKCFLTGRHIYEHSDPAKHPMQEYCCKTSSGESVRDFSRILRNNLYMRNKSVAKS